MTTRTSRRASTSSRCSSTPPAPTPSSGWCSVATHPITPGTSARARSKSSSELCLAVDADTVVFDNELSPGAAVQPGEAARPHGARPHRGDPRHLRPERPHPRRQGPGRAGAAALPAAPAAAWRQTPKLSQQRGGVGARFGGGETKLEVDRRRIMRRINKLERELADLQRDPLAAAQGARPQRPGYRGDRRLHQRRQVVAPEPPDRSRACSSRTACSPRSIRPRGACRCPAASPCCCPTPSASSTACPTASSSRSRARSRSVAGRLSGARRRRQRSRSRRSDRRRAKGAR